MTNINFKNIPNHIAIIMDGNGRWAKNRKMPRIEGHRRGVKAVKKITKYCAEIGIKKLTLYTFSSENWKRPIREVNGLMSLLVKTIRKETKDLIKNNVNFTTIGNLDKLPKNVYNELMDTINKTSMNCGLNLNLAINYGGRQEITSLCKKIANEVKSNIIKPDDISENYLNTKISIDNYSDPDLLIRTGGNFRISNFMLWQIAYSEIYITNRFWPEFGKNDLIDALKNYNKRDRRFGDINVKK